ncbi:MAG TPA: TIGR02302 family protein [Rhizomicrobium sp.]
MLPLTVFLPGSKAEPHQRHVASAQLALLWERVWPRLWPASGVLGFYVALALAGLIGVLPPTLRGLLLLTLFGILGFLLYQAFLDFRIPTWTDAARRVERDSTLAHRPLSGRDDHMAVGVGDGTAESLWNAHLERLLRRLVRLRVRLPSPGLATRDPHGARYAILLLLVVGLFVAGTDSSRRLSLAFSFDTGVAGADGQLDAWITPPAFTGEAPIYLQRGGHAAVSVPTGSELVLRAHGVSDVPLLMLEPVPEAGRTEFAGASHAYGASAKLAQDSDVRVTVTGHLLGHWHIHVVPNRPPVIVFSAAPSATDRGVLKLSFVARDAYGVATARAVIRPLSRHARATLSVDLPLTGSSPREIAQTVYRDLTLEPLAGLDVGITLEAKNAAGLVGHSQTVRVRLPERIFTNPLARALVEQRRVLAAEEPHGKQRVLRVLDALSIAPERFYVNQSGVYLAIRSAYWSLSRARGERDVEDVEALLWETANALESGGQLDAANQLRNIQHLLNQALSQGAPQSVIDDLLQRYAQALQRYMQMLAQNAPRANAPAPPNAKMIKPEDLAALLKAIQQLAETGARDQAQQMLSMLQNLIENMRMGSGSGSGGGAESQALSGAIQGLGDIIGRQRQLLDKTFRESQSAGDPKDGGGKGLSEQQGKLRDDVDKIGKAMRDQKASGADKLGDAGRAMSDAQKALGQGDFARAGSAQKSALDALRSGAGALAQELMKANGQGDSQSGQQDRQDPLGRPEGPAGNVGDGSMKLPNQSELQRARSILEELRRRAAQPGRPKDELDYLDRLLKEF